MSSNYTQVPGITDVPGDLYGASYDKSSGTFIFNRSKSSLRSEISELKRRLSVLETTVNSLKSEILNG